MQMTSTTTRTAVNNQEVNNKEEVGEEDKDDRTKS